MLERRASGIEFPHPKVRPQCLRRGACPSKWPLAPENILPRAEDGTQCFETPSMLERCASGIGRFSNHPKVRSSVCRSLCFAGQFARCFCHEVLFHPEKPHANTL
jgi:hypothetical protein